MNFSIETGSLTDAARVDGQIPEFERNKSAAELAERLGGKQHLVLIAKHGDKPVGYLVGYAHSETEFYNWLTGVSPEHRNRGVATQLLEAVEKWAEAQKYQQLTVKSKNSFPSMLRLLIGRGYRISGYEQLGSLLDNKIHFTRKLG